MPLLKPLPGDLADRQCILELKINHCTAEFDEESNDPFTRKRTLVTGKTETTVGIARVLVSKGAADVTPFIDELDLIRKELEKKWVPDLITKNKVEEYDKLYDQLNEANTTLWGLEDTIRALKASPEDMESTLNWLKRVKDTAFDIVIQNDARSEVIKQINALWGWNRQEKMY
jgi:hypothetical protein